jgi:hypothetical protein
MSTTGDALGSTPFGTGTPVAAATPPSQESTLVRYISPGTRDYELDTTTGQLRQMPVLRQRVTIIALTRRGSSAVLPNMGIAWPDKMGDGFERETDNEIRAAYNRLTEIERVMSIDSTSVYRGARGRAEMAMTYTDLQTGLPDSVSTDPFKR